MKLKSFRLQTSYQIGLGKSHSCDGLNIKFYRAFFGDIKEEILTIF